MNTSPHNKKICMLGLEKLEFANTFIDKKATYISKAHQGVVATLVERKTKHMVMT
jgi:hypothetical protein